MSKIGFSSMGTPEQGGTGGLPPNQSAPPVSLAATLPSQFVPPTDRPTSTPQRLNREAIARYVLSHESQIRAIARRKLTQAARSTFDSEDVMASVLRRVDQLALNGVLRPDNEGELWSLIKTIASNTAVTKTRLIERTRFLLTEDGAYAYYLLQRLNACGSDDEAQLLVLRMASTLKSERSRQILLLRLRGATHEAISGMLGMSEGACRQQWMETRQELQAAFEGGNLHA